MASGGNEKTRLDKLKKPPMNKYAYGDQRTNFSSYPIPSDILDFTTTPGTRF